MLKTKKKKLYAKTQGADEWCKSKVNIQVGCPRGCVYCYACRSAIRFKRIKDYAEWVTYQWINPKKVRKRYRKRTGRIMFPTSHGIYLSNYISCVFALGNMLEAGNEVLITTKPALKVIAKMLMDLDKYKELVQFRFTITSCDAHISSRYEPYAPSPLERLEALMLAYEDGWKTSVSIEPYLDIDPSALIKAVEPYCSESIWVGVMSGGFNTDVPGISFREFCMRYSKEHISSLVDIWESLGKGKLWLKDSIRNLLGISSN